MKDKSRRDARRNGKDSAPPPIRENAKGKYHQDSQYGDFGNDRSHETPLPCEAFGSSTPQYVPLATLIPAENLTAFKLTHYPRPEMISPLSAASER
jgi:hypothetical protein